jgi:hypothetical protein
LMLLALFLFFLPTFSKWRQRLSAKKEAKS